MSDQEAWQLSDSAAVAYERDFVPALFAQWPPVIVEIAQIAPGDRVLDVACGTGVLARGVLARVVPNGNVTGIDLNEGMLAVARSIEPRVDWRQGDAMRLPFAEGAFDAVVSQFAMMFFPDPVVALREMRRVLAPGRSPRGRRVRSDSRDERLPPAGRHSAPARWRRCRGHGRGVFCARGRSQTPAARLKLLASPMLGYSLAKGGRATPRSTSFSASRSWARRWRRSSTKPPSSGSVRLRARR